MTEKPNQDLGIISYNVTDTAIAEMSDKYLPLKINGLNDKEGQKIVRSARLDVKNKRISVEKKRKELKAEALEYGRKVDAEARRITDLLSPIESHLKVEEENIEREKEKIKAEAEAKRKRMVQERVDKLTAFNAVLNLEAIERATEKEFNEMLNFAMTHFELAQEKERVRLKEEARHKALAEATEKARHEKEEKRLADERKEIERIKQEQEVTRLKLEREQKEIADHKMGMQMEIDRHKANESFAGSPTENQEEIINEAEMEKLGLERRPDFIGTPELKNEILLSAKKTWSDNDQLLRYAQDLEDVQAPYFLKKEESKTTLQAAELLLVDIIIYVRKKTLP